MGKTRLDLHEFLCEKIHSRNVYFRPPESIKMKYPAIKYDLAKMDNRNANNSPYIKSRGYEIILIDNDPDSELVDVFTDISLCTFERNYTADGLNHWVFTLFY